jgi:hypothetical protein
MTRALRRQTVLLAAIAMLLPGVALAQAQWKITEVRVYRGGALVTREVPFDAKAGPQEVVVGDLPERVVSASLYATGTEGVAIRAVRYRMTAVEEEPRPEVRALDDKIKKCQADMNRIESELKVLEQRTKYLDKLETFSAEKATDELSKGTLNPKALTETATFIFTQRSQTSEDQLRLEAEKETVQQTLQTLQRERATIAPTANRTRREAIVFLEADKAGPSRFALSYLVDGVGWAPAYSARLDTSHEKLALEYHAVVTQTSGEDWPDVQLTLSTSHPRMLASAPLLAPLRIALVTGAEQVERQAAAEGAKDYTDKKRQLAQQIRSSGYGAGMPGGPAGPQGPRGDRGQQGPPGMTPGGMMPGAGGLAAAPPAQPGMEFAAGEAFVNENALAAQLQNVELQASDEAVRMSKAMAAEDTEGLAVDYDIPGRVSLQSRRDQQMFRIATLDLKADFYYTAVPLLTDYVYQAVDAVNTSDTPLLPGPYNAYLDGAFAGQGALPLVARGQSLTVGLGALTYTYRLRLRNFMDQPVKVRVWDRMPQAPDKQVTVTLITPEPPLSEDAVYTSYEKPRGLLRWDVEVPAHAAGAQVYTFTYKFQLEFDKTYNIGELPAQIAEAMRTDLDMLRSIRAFGGYAGGEK